MADSQLPSAVDAEFLPSVTASCQGGLMTIKVETKQSFQGKRTIHRYVLFAMVLYLYVSVNYFKLLFTVTLRSLCYKPFRRCILLATVHICCCCCAQKAQQRTHARTAIKFKERACLLRFSFCGNGQRDRRGFNRTRHVIL